MTAVSVMMVMVMLPTVILIMKILTIIKETKHEKKLMEIIFTVIM